MVLDQKKVACILQVGGEVLPQVEEFKYLGVLFTSEGRMDREIDRRIGAVAAVMRSMYRSVVVKKELSQKAKLSIYQSIYVLTLTYGHELWVMTERVRSRIQTAEMSFLRRVAGRSLRDRVRSSVTQEDLGVEPMLLHIERGQLRWLGHLFRMPPGRLPGEVFRACPTGKRPRGRPRTRWRDLSFGWPGKASGSLRKSWRKWLGRGRPQHVRSGHVCSTTITLNTGVPQGWVLSPFLYSLITHDCRPVYGSNSIIKFADDTTVIGLISENDETAYRAEVQHLVAWCADNNLLLNTSKT
ncbi:hypothetical protein QTP86_015499 [Hemibagrus guttatus]|nr:hypothetical protein QTP86_015499 [Hemibagrus guttatus]